MAELNEAVDRVIAGPERKSRVITPIEKEIIAYHEGGHAVAGHFLPRADPVFKVTIVARGMAGGFTRSLPADDRRLQDRSYYEAMMAQALGGHVAEEMIFGEPTTGAHDDIGKVTHIARDMVTQWGMSARLGPRTFGRRDSMVFLGRDIAEQRDYSERTAEEIDDEVRRIIEEAHERCPRGAGQPPRKARRTRRGADGDRDDRGRRPLPSARPRRGPRDAAGAHRSTAPAGGASRSHRRRG